MIELSSDVTAIDDSSFGWNLMEVIGSVCHLKVNNYSEFFPLSLEHILKSQTLTEQSSLPVTIKWVAILFQSQTLTSA